MGAGAIPPILALTGYELKTCQYLYRKEIEVQRISNRGRLFCYVRSSSFDLLEILNFEMMRQCLLCC